MKQDENWVGYYLALNKGTNDKGQKNSSREIVCSCIKMTESDTISMRKPITVCKGRPGYDVAPTQCSLAGRTLQGQEEPVAMQSRGRTELHD